VTIRGLPVVSSGRQWAFRIKGIPTAPGVAGTIIADGDARMQALLDEMNESVVLNFQDLFGKQYHVTAKYQRTPAYDGAQTRIGSMVDLNLEELTA